MDVFEPHLHCQCPLGILNPLKYELAWCTTSSLYALTTLDRGTQGKDLDRKVARALDLLCRARECQRGLGG